MKYLSNRKSAAKRKSTKSGTKRPYNKTGKYAMRYSVTPKGMKYMSNRKSAAKRKSAKSAAKRPYNKTGKYAQKYTVTAKGMKYMSNRKSAAKRKQARAETPVQPIDIKTERLLSNCYLEEVSPSDLL